jgi:hypothetical protein
MRNFPKYPLLLAAAGAAIIFVSWNQHNTTLYSARNSEWKSNNFFSSLNENDLASLEAEDYWDNYYEPARSAPPAEDVLVQRIPGDNDHLLIMAYYSKDHYSGPSLAINSGGTQLIFRDDGTGDDKVAGDGLFTAKIAVNVNEFRQRALRIKEEMKSSGYKPVRFVNRSMIIDPDKTEDFDVTALDDNRAVSIAGLEAGAAASNKLLDSLRANSIFLTKKKVVEDPSRTWNSCTQTGNVNGAWTFKTLMRELASSDPQHKATDQELSDFVKNWFTRWKSNRIINGDTVPARPLVDDKILQPWLDKSKAHGSPLGQLDLKFAPFKLTAIVNRFDLRDIFLGIPGGQVRFVFCLIDTTCTKAENYTIIIEYDVNKPDICDSLMPWAKQWYNLKNLELGSEEYNVALQKITNQVTLCGDNVKRAHQSCLSKIRTNDRSLLSRPTEFREFALTQNGLVETTVADAPADKYNAQVDNPDVERMAKWVNDNQKGIIDSQVTMPKSIDGVPFLGGRTTIKGKPVGDPEKAKVFHWDGAKKEGPAFIKNNGARHNFSLNTCSGCHAGETQTGFNHVSAVFFGKEAKLSGFLSGTPKGNAYDFDGDPDNDSMMVEDAALRPDGDPKVRMFNDILRRAKDLKRFVNDNCGDLLQIRDQLLFKPVRQVH